VIPISVPESRDLLKITVQRWSRVNKANIKDDALQLLWLGGLDWWPNREALEWFAQHIWKQLQKNRPRVSLTLVGRGTDRLRDLSGENVRRLGFVKDLSAVFDETDLLIAPIQSGSGVRVKVIEALSQAVPCLGTPLGVEGISPQGIYCVDSPQEWLRVLSSVTVQECFLRGMVGARAIQAEHSRVRCAGQFDALLQNHLKS
jgi:glycosyltransferase involved in cell wall biosynthesis